MHIQNKEAAREAYRAKKEALNAPVMTYAQVADVLNRAEDRDAIDTEADLINQVDDKVHRK